MANYNGITVRFGCWTVAERKRLFDMRIAGHSFEQISAEMGRSVGSLKAMLNRERRRQTKGTPPMARIPLHGLDLSKVHHSLRALIKIAATEGYTYRTLSKKVGISRGTLANIVNGNPTYGNVVALADALDCQIKIVQKQEQANGD
jgi:lambda repressor-like predicted transcriptional regulator